jgi:hypothetical protein
MGVAGDGTFTASIESFVGKALAKNDAVCRKVFGELATNIIMATPVDTGMARANWMPSIGSPDLSTTESTDYESAKNNAKITAMSWKPKETDAYLSNSLPYIKVLEYGLYPNPPKKGKGKTVYGYSTQAPAGMVGITIAKMQGKV